jgi:primosomal protein N' (replication factor Y)
MIPDDLVDAAMPGVRVTVQFGGNRSYTGIISDVHNRPPVAGKARPVISVIDGTPLINSIQLKFWNWISEYYLCAEGEVMKAALPSEIGQNNFRPRFENYICLASSFTEAELNKILDSLGKAPRQQEMLSAWIRLSGYTESSPVAPVKKSLLLAETRSSSGIIEVLVKKGYLSEIPLEVTRLAESTDNREPVKVLSEAQQSAYNKIKNVFDDKDIVLLHGVTSSGKTELYIHLIEEQLKNGRQVLYMLPEIALTTQIIERLKRHFGSLTGVYHSRFSEPEKAEIWQKVAVDDPLNGFRLILGVRSSLFLPFRNLGLIIVDEEHDGSYKQQDPAPRYHARDSAIMLAALHNAKTILGSASPSIESYNNAVKGKYGLVELKERFGNIRLPDIILANTREAYKRRLMVSHFTPELLHAIDEALGNEEQVILFQNRRGFSPYIECSECGWIPVCIQCAQNRLALVEPGILIDGIFMRCGCHLWIVVEMVNGLPYPGCPLMRAGQVAIFSIADCRTVILPWRRNTQGADNRRLKIFQCRLAIGKDIGLQRHQVEFHLANQPLQIDVILKGLPDHPVAKA